MCAYHVNIDIRFAKGSRCVGVLYEIIKSKHLDAGEKNV